MFPWERVSACLASQALLRYWCNWGICFALGNSLICRQKGLSRRPSPELLRQASSLSLFLLVSLSFLLLHWFCLMHVGFVTEVGKSIKNTNIEVALTR